MVVVVDVANDGMWIIIFGFSSFVLFECVLRFALVEAWGDGCWLT